MVYYLNGSYRRIIHEGNISGDSLGTFARRGVLATSEELPGLVAQGRTAAETLEIAQDVARKLIESYLEHGDGLPPKLQAAAPASGKVRIPVSVP